MRQILVMTHGIDQLNGLVVEYLSRRRRLALSCIRALWPLGMRNHRRRSTGS